MVIVVYNNPCAYANSAFCIDPPAAPMTVLCETIVNL